MPPARTSVLALPASTPAAVPAAPARRAAAIVAVVIAVAGLLVTLGFTIADEPPAALHAHGGLAIFLGNVTGMVGTYLALIQVLLASRIPPVEHVLGLDGLIRWHRRVGPWPISLLTVHAVALTIGYAQAAKTGLMHEVGTLVGSYPGLLAAFVALGLMLLAGFASVRAVRRRLRRETWWAIHLYLYLAIALSFTHVLVLGPEFVGHPVVKVVWWVVWLATAGSVLVFRFGLPAARSLRHRLVVWEVRRETPDTVSIICRGRNLERLHVQGGQFALWRFMARDLWWQAHPYTVSGLPQRSFMRLTVKNVGDHSKALASLRRGTRVAFEGPYGVFTAEARRHARVALIAAGAGVTSLRPVLEKLPAGTDPVVVLRASRAGGMPLRDEVAALVDEKNGALHELYGSRRAQLLDGRRLRQLIPDIRARDVYVSGPEDFVNAVTNAVRRLGVPTDAVHHEAYAL